MFATLGLARGLPAPRLGPGAADPRRRWRSRSRRFFSWALLALGAFAALVALQRDRPAAGARDRGRRAASALARPSTPRSTPPPASTRSARSLATEAYDLGISNAPPVPLLAVRLAGRLRRRARAADRLVRGARARHGRRRGGRARSRSSSSPSVIGLTKAETERIWLFMGPLAARRRRGAGPARRMPLVLALLAVQALATRCCWTRSGEPRPRHRRRRVHRLPPRRRAARARGGGADPRQPRSARPPDRASRPPTCRPRPSSSIGDLRSGRRRPARSRASTGSSTSAGSSATASRWSTSARRSTRNPGGTATLLEEVIARRDADPPGRRRLLDGRLRRGLLPLRRARRRRPRAAPARAAPRAPLGAASARDCGASSSRSPSARTRPLRPVSVYGISKRDTEELALVLGEAYGFEASRCAT